MSIEDRWKDSEFLPVTPERAKQINSIREQLGLPTYPEPALGTASNSSQIKKTPRPDYKLLKELVGLAGEHLAAGELFRRGVYAQITYGNRKKVDILIDGSTAFARVDVKSKQGREWPGVKGISPREKNSFLILVDLCKKRPEERPDYYVMNQTDWHQFAQKTHEDHPQGGAPNEDDVMYYPGGNGWYGIGIKAEQIQEYREHWEKIIDAVGPPSVA